MAARSCSAGHRTIIRAYALQLPQDQVTRARVRTRYPPRRHDVHRSLALRGLHAARGFVRAGVRLATGRAGPDRPRRTVLCADGARDARGSRVLGTAHLRRAAVREADPLLLADAALVRDAR